MNANAMPACLLFVVCCAGEQSSASSVTNAIAECKLEGTVSHLSYVLLSVRCLMPQTT